MARWRKNLLAYLLLLVRVCTVCMYFHHQDDWHNYTLCIFWSVTREGRLQLQVFIKQSSHNRGVVIAHRNERGRYVNKELGGPASGASHPLPRPPAPPTPARALFRNQHEIRLEATRRRPTSGANTKTVNSSSGINDFLIFFTTE